MAPSAIRQRLHPSARLVLAACLIVAAFVAHAAIIAPALLIAAGLGGEAQRNRWYGLVRRSRWLLLAILLAVGLTEPGEHFYPGFPGTREGMAAALEQLLRILASLLIVAWLVLAERSELIAGVLGVGWLLGRRARPLFARLAVRLAMVIELVEDRRVHWVDLLSGPVEAATGTPMAVRLVDWTPGDRQYLLLGAVALVIAMVWRG